jgi:hypothetical protein
MSDSDFSWEREFEEHQVDDAVWLDEPEVEEKEIDEEPISQDIHSLLSLGELTQEFDIRGNKIILRTLKVGEELEIATFIQPFMGSVDEGRALATASIAAAIVSLNGAPIVRAIGPEENLLRKKFDFVREKMYWPVIRLLYEEAYIPLLQRQTQAVKEFQKK